MKFISKRVIKVPRYKIICFTLIILLILIIVLNFGISWFLTHGNSTFLNLLGGNSFGNTLKSYNVYNNNKLYFYKNSFGIYFNNRNNTSFKSVANPLVYIYNSYQNAQYKNNYVNLYNVTPVATQASLILQEYLENNGIFSIVELNRIDNDKDTLIKNAKSNYSSLKYFFDLQIANLNYNDTTYKINDINYAKLFFLVNKDQESIVNNLKKRLDNSLIGEIKTTPDNTFIIMVGGKENTISEVNRTLKILGDALAQYIKEDGL